MQYSIINYSHMLYITSPWLIYFITGSLYLLTTFTHFTHPSTPASGIHQSVLFMYEVSGFYEILHISEVVYGICLSLTYFILYNAFKVHPHCCKWQDFLLLWLNNKNICIYIIYMYIYIFFFIHSIVLATVNVPKKCADIFLSYCFNFFQINTQKWNFWII